VSLGTEQLPGDIKFNADGLVVVIAQDAATGTIRMVAWADKTAIERTIETGQAHFFSRSRSRLWRKGEESGNVLQVHAVWLDCDGDALIYRVSPVGPTCHTGRPTCFFDRRFPQDTGSPEIMASGSILETLDMVVEARRTAQSDESYMASLLHHPERARTKIIEEAEELCQALESEDDERVASELADLLFHALVAAQIRGVSSSDALRTLLGRLGVSGHIEKKSRNRE